MSDYFSAPAELVTPPSTPQTLRARAIQCASAIPKGWLETLRANPTLARTLGNVRNNSPAPPAAAPLITLGWVESEIKRLNALLATSPEEQPYQAALLTIWTKMDMMKCRAI